MTYRYIIEGDTIRHVREEVLAEAPFESVRQHLIEQRPTQIPILPSAAPTRLVHIDPTEHTGHVLLELTPRYQHLRVAHAGRYPEDENHNRDGGIDVFRVLLPYTYFLFNFRYNAHIPGSAQSFTVNSSRLLWRLEPYHSREDEFYAAAVPNVDTSAGICWGSTVRPQPTLTQYIDAMVNEYFTTTFNEDLGHRTPFGTSLTQWEAASDNPLAYRDWSFWSEARHYPLDHFVAYERHHMDVTEFGDYFVEMPEIPANFTVARAREWIASLDDRARARLLAAVEPVEEEVPA